MKKFNFMPSVVLYFISLTELLEFIFLIRFCTWYDILLHLLHINEFYYIKKLLYGNERSFNKFLKNCRIGLNISCDNQLIKT